MENLPLQIQRLGGQSEQALVLLHVAELQSDLRSASPATVRGLFDLLRIPAPSNVSENLKRLAARKLAVNVGGGQWAVTPEGKEAILEYMSGVDPADLAAMASPRPEAVFGSSAHHLIPPEFAPAAFQPGIARFLQGHPFESNVFCMTRFPQGESDVLTPALESIRDACRHAGLELHLASDRTVEDLLFGNVAAAMWASRFGIGIFESRTPKGINHNLSIEVGGMLITGRRCLLLKDSPTVKDMPTDLVGYIYQSVDLSDTDSVRTAVMTWTGTVTRGG